MYFPKIERKCLHMQSELNGKTQLLFSWQKKKRKEKGEINSLSWNISSLWVSPITFWLKDPVIIWKVVFTSSLQDDTNITSKASACIYNQSTRAWSSLVTLTGLCNGWDRSWIIQQSNVLSITWFLPALSQKHLYSVAWQRKLHCPACQYLS